MNNPHPSYSSSFGLLQAEPAPDNQFVWKADFHPEHPLFSGAVPVYLLTASERLSPEMLRFTEEIVARPGEYIEKSLLYIQHADRRSG